MSVHHDPDSFSAIPPTTESITPSVNQQQYQPNSNNSNSNLERKHFSIERSLELERQLELESDKGSSSVSSPPPTPSISASSIHQYQHNDENLNPLDPQILAHIITGLRKTVEDMTKERGDLLKLLERATTREASLQDTLALMTEKATDYEEELSNARKKMKEDEEAISLLRNKVEESRRGLMRLQAESRRQSVQVAQGPGSLDLISSLGLTSPPPSASSKRASFTPLTGRSNIGGHGHGHRRVSSIAGDGNNGLAVLQLPTELNSPSPSPNGQQTSLNNNHDGLPPPSSARRSLFRSSPPNAGNIPLPPIPTSTPSPEIGALKKELEGLKKELVDTRAELDEANEAKEASDTCVKALREFIAENQVGIGGATSGDLSSALKLPPPPMSVDLSDKKTVAAAAPSSGWGFKLWKADTSPASTATISTSPSTQTPTTMTTAVTAPFSRFGGFFGSRGSVSSTTTSSSLQTNAALPLARESGTSSSSYRNSISGRSVSAVSDASSSVVEPASPETDFSTPQGTFVKVVVNDISENEEESIGADGMIRNIPPVEKDPIQAQQHATVVG